MFALEMNFVGDATQADNLCACLERFGAGAVSLQAAGSHAHRFDEPGRSEPSLWDVTGVEAMFGEETDLDPILLELNVLFPDNLSGFKVRSIQDEPWEQSWKQHFRPRYFGDKLCVIPSWGAPAAHGVSVVLDPGMAFGTGNHATTAMCLSWLAACEFIGGARFLDYGCGSGILGIAAAKLGAGTVTAVDLDPQALDVARINASRNRVADSIQLSEPGAENPAGYDIIMANILANPLVALAPRLAGLAAAASTIVLSGILAEQAEQCLDAYRPWFNIRIAARVDEWMLLTGESL